MQLAATTQFAHAPQTRTPTEPSSSDPNFQRGPRMNFRLNRREAMLAALGVAFAREVPDKSFCTCLLWRRRARCGFSDDAGVACELSLHVQPPRAKLELLGDCCRRR